MNTPSPALPEPAYSRCPGCDNFTMHCVCGEEPTTDSWRPMVAGTNLWPLVLIASLLLSGCKVTSAGQAKIDSLIAGAAHWMDRISLGCVVITALGVSYLFCRILGHAIAKPRGTRGLGLDLDRGDPAFDCDERVTFGYQERPRARLQPLAPSDDPMVGYVGANGEAVLIPRSLAIKLSLERPAEYQPHRRPRAHGFEF